MTASNSASSGGIFISYRREDTAYPAGWLFDRLVDHFGADQVFRDIDSIQLGDDFAEKIRAAVGSCAVLLAVIGDRWLTVTGEDGKRRLDDPSDYVRLEIEAALTRNVLVIPVLVAGARIPHSSQLPASLAKLAGRQALELSPSRFNSDIRYLLSTLDKTLSEKFAQRAPQVAAPETKQPRSARTGQANSPIPDLLSLEQERQALEQELIGLLSGNGDPAREAELRAALEQNTDQRLRAAQREQSRRGEAASVFVSYAREDEGMLKKLSDHLGGLHHGGYIKDWSDGQVLPGHEWAPEIIRRLDEADIILLLVTSSFLGSGFIGGVEFTRALERHRRGEAIVIPVILKPADWLSTSLAELQALPKDGKAVSTWSDRDAAYLDIARGLRHTIDAWRASQQ